MAASSGAEYTFYAFKKARKDSLLKHTGVYYTVTVGSETRHWIHEVTNGVEGFTLSGPNKSHIILRPKKDYETFETSHIITTIYIEDSQAIDSLFIYEEAWEYHVLWKNCRDHVLHFVGRLREQGHAISETVEDWIKEIKRNDIVAAAGVTAAVGIGTYLIGSFIASFFTHDTPEEKDKNNKRLKANIS